MLLEEEVDVSVAGPPGIPAPHANWIGKVFEVVVSVILAILVTFATVNM